MSDTMRLARPPRLEPWRDARRTSEHYRPDAPDTFEWWYFDGQFADGGAVVVAFVIEPDPAKDRFSYRTQVYLHRPGRPAVTTYHRTDDVAISTERPDGRIGAAWFRAYGDGYRVFVDPASHDGVGVDLTINRVVPSRVSPADNDIVFGGDTGLGWVNAVPRGEMSGTLTVDGQTTDVRGTAYHDHNWGQVTMASLVHHWVWGRAAIGPYTAVFANVFPTRPYRTGDTGIQSIYIASPDGVLVNVCGPGAARMTAPTAVNPDPRNHDAFFSPHVVFDVAQDDRRITVDVTTAQFFHDIDLLEETHYLNADERARAAQMAQKPWYTEFLAAPVRLTIEDSRTGESESYQGSGLIEFMDFHLNEL